MAFLKSVFISGFIMYLALSSLYALAQVVRGMDPILGWLGMALAALGPLAYFTWIMLARPARTPRLPLDCTLVSGLGLAISMAMAWKHGPAAGLIHVWAGAAFIGWFVYLRWYSPFQKRDTGSLQRGSELPAFRLQNLRDEIVNSELFRGSPHVLVFYRGNWCPFCTAQIRELAESYQEIAATGAQVMLISPQPLKEHQKLAKRYAIPVEFLRDRDNEAARTLGILAPWAVPMGMQVAGYDSDAALPTVLVTDVDGRILYSHLTDNYRIRPEPSEFLSVLQSASAR